MSSVRAGGTADARPWARHGSINIARLALIYGLAPVVKAIPLFHTGAVHVLADEDAPKSPADASLWLYLGIALALVFGGGIFAGLTIAYVPRCPYRAMRNG
jgi:metal transporter CNNM